MLGAKIDLRNKPLTEKRHWFLLCSLDLERKHWMVTSATYGTPIRGNIVEQDVLMMMPIEVLNGIEQGPTDAVSITSPAKGAFRGFNTVNLDDLTFPWGFLVLQML